MRILYFLVATLFFHVCPASAQDTELITLSSFETRYGDYGRYRGRAHNIRHSAELISPTTLQPGERFSFNQIVGIRTQATGFREAPVIVFSRLTTDYGGGICQTASTIYAAAMHAGLRVVEHHPHSRISPYIRPGLDATVDWDSKDLVLENPYPFPVTLTVTTFLTGRPAEEAVRVEIRAREQLFDVRIRTIRRELSGFNTIEEADPTLGVGQRHIAEHGTPRTYVIFFRTLIPLDETRERTRERREIMYEASDRIIRVGTAQEVENE